MKLRCNFRGGSIHRLQDQCYLADRGGSLAHSNLVLPYWGRRETKRKKMKGRGRTVTKERYIWIWKNNWDIFKASSLMNITRLAKLTLNFPKNHSIVAINMKYISFYSILHLHLKIANRSLKFYIIIALIYLF